MDSYITGIKNKLIVYMTNGKLSFALVKEIQELLLNGKKKEEFEVILEKVEKCIK